MSKADRLGASSSFAAAASARSARRQLIESATGDTPPSDIRPVLPAMAEPPRLVPIGELVHNPFNPRMDLGELQETADSLLEKGQIQPITVITRKAFLEAHPDQDGELSEASYVVLDGNRRLGAARMAGLEELRVDVNDALAGSAADMLEAALVANLHREDLKPLEEARTLAELVDVHGSQRQVARRIGKSNAWVSQRLALLSLEPDLQDQVRTGELKVEDARRIGKLPAERQHDAVQKTKQARQDQPSRRNSKVPAQRPHPDQGSGTRSGVNAVNGREDGADTDVDWTDPAALANVIRHRLSPEQRNRLVELLLQTE